MLYRTSSWRSGCCLTPAAGSSQGDNRRRGGEVLTFSTMQGPKMIQHSKILGVAARPSPSDAELHASYPVNRQIAMPKILRCCCALERPCRSAKLTSTQVPNKNPVWTSLNCEFRHCGINALRHRLIITSWHSLCLARPPVIQRISPARKWLLLGLA